MTLTASRFLDPRADVVFKKVFGEHANLPAGFLNAVMPLTSPIVGITYLPSEQAPDIPELKRPIVDVRCEDEDRRTFIVEMQMEWRSYCLSFKSSTHGTGRKSALACCG